MTTTQILIAIGFLILLIQVFRPNQVVVVRDREDYFGCTGIFIVIVFILGVLLIAFFIAIGLSDTPTAETPKNDGKNSPQEQVSDSLDPLINKAPRRQFRDYHLNTAPSPGQRPAPAAEEELMETAMNRNIYEPKPNVHCAILLKRFLKLEDAQQFKSRFSHWGTEVFTVHNDARPYWNCVLSRNEADAWRKINAWYANYEAFEGMNLEFEIIYLDIQE